MCKKFKEYGQLSGISIEQRKAGARIEVDESKHHPADFALWIKAPKEHIMQWKSPWGMGYPGWHIECSAIGQKIFGRQNRYSYRWNRPHYCSSRK